jgi:2-methylcitrate synthase
MSSSYSPGLEGVIGGQTAICRIDAGLQYRGYTIEDLARDASFEEVAYLLLVGALPSRSQLDTFCQCLVAERAVPREIFDVLGKIPADAPPMDVLRSGVSLLGHFDADLGDDGHEANVRKAVRLTAQIPTLLAARHRLARGEEPVAPNPSLSHAANLLWLITGREPDPFDARVLDVSLILYAEHEYNASAFAARVTVSTLSDLHSGVVSAIGALKGPLHGGANEAAMATLLEIGTPERAEPWVRQALAERRRVMGFGHRMYKHGDRRATILKEYARRLGERRGDLRWYQISATLERIMEEEKGLYPNVDFPCGSTYYLLGLPVELYTPIFVASRVTGWAAHIIEQLDNNRLIRPSSEYIGPPARPYIPISDR